MIPEIPEEFVSIQNFFTIPKDITDNKFSFKPKRDTNKLKEILDQFTIEMLKFREYNKDISIIRNIVNNWENLQYYILSGKKIYIPLLGVSNSGKSTILNDLCGNEIFPTAEKECTTKGILIQYKDINGAELYKVSAVPLSVEGQVTYVFKEENKTIVQNIKGVKDALDAFNKNFSDLDKSFFMVKCRIKILDEILDELQLEENIKEDYKEKVCFIDLTGHDTVDNPFNHDKEKSEFNKKNTIKSFMESGNGSKNKKKKRNR